MILRVARDAAQCGTIDDVGRVEQVVFILWEIEIRKYDSLTVTWQNVTVIGNEEIRKHGNSGKMKISGGCLSRAGAYSLQ